MTVLVRFRFDPSVTALVCEMGRALVDAEIDEVAYELQPRLFGTGLTPPFVNGDDALAEFVCPASDEARHRTTCAVCQLCRGTSSPARSVVILAHGKPSNLKVFCIDIRGTVARAARKVRA